MFEIKAYVSILLSQIPLNPQGTLLPSWNPFAGDPIEPVSECLPGGAQGIPTTTSRPLESLREAPCISKSTSSRTRDVRGSPAVRPFARRAQIPRGKQL